MRQSRCRKCGKVFEYEGLPPPLCPVCQKARDEKLQQMRTMIRENPGITVPEVSRATGVPPEVILKFVREGMIETV